MANSIVNSADDPVLTGYSRYSKFRVGNLIAINGIYKGVGIIVIGEILALEHEGDRSLFEIKNLSNNATAFVKPSAPGPFGALILFPENLGFRQDPDNRHSLMESRLLLVMELKISMYSTLPLAISYMRKKKSMTS